MITVIENFISEEDSAFFIEYINKNKDNKDKFPLTRGEAKGKVRSEANIPELVDLKQHSDALDKIKLVSNKVLEQFKKMSGNDNLVICSFWMALLGPTTKIPMHKDDIKFAEHLYLSCVVYLNEDYDGGSITFRDEEFTYKPKKYSAIFFPSSYYHEVETIDNGVRITLPVWASKDETRDMFLDNPIITDPFKTAGVDENDPALSYLIDRYNNH
jgi:hypothetical protein